MKNKIPTLDWNDTFIDVKHLRASFPDYKIRATEDDRSKHVPPFRYLLLIHHRGKKAVRQLTVILSHLILRE
jgi:hypothetical protein